MKPSKLQLAYFSPCGGTLRAAELLCGQFEGVPVERVNMTCPPGALPGVIPVKKEELLVLAFPVYGGVPPRVEGLFRQLKGQGGPCVLLAAYGNRAYEDALAARDLCAWGAWPVLPPMCSRPVWARAGRTAARTWRRSGRLPKR